MKPFKVAVMYGSQTGNAQSIAEGIHDGCRKKGVESTLLKCDAWKKMNPELKEWSALVLVVSTTGNGDAPENSERFWRFMKRRTQPKDLLEGLAFSVLGLGDTNYDKFCYMGKSFDKRLRELGAVPFLSPAFADEATNMEETIEPWLASLYASLETLRDGGNGGGVPQGAPAAVAVTPAVAASPQQQQGRQEGRAGGREAGQQTVAAAAAAASGGQENAPKTAEEAPGVEERAAAAAAAAVQEQAAAAAAAAAAAQEKEAAAAAAREKAAAVAAQEKAAAVVAQERAAATAAAAAAAEKAKAAAATSTDIAESRSAPLLTPQENGSDHLRPASSAGSNGAVAGDTQPASRPQPPSETSGPANGISGNGVKTGGGDEAAATPGTKESLPPHRIAVMYGSQTGNAQSIAEGIHDSCKRRGSTSTLLACDGWKKMTPELKEWSALVLVVSTTGNGDAPENTERFWRFLKRRSQPKDLLGGLAFTVLGLGDTNYDKFCHMGKSFDKRLRELGAVPFHSPAFADEATNMEETIEPWLATLYPALRASLVAAGSAVAGGVAGEGAKTPGSDATLDSAATASSAAAVAAGPAGIVSDAAAPSAEVTVPTKEMEAAGATVAGAEDVTEAIRGAAVAVFQESPEQPAAAVAAAAAVANGLRPTTSTSGRVAPASAAAAASPAPTSIANPAVAPATAEGAAEALAELTLADTAKGTPPSPPPSSSGATQPGQAPAPTDQTSVSGSSSTADTPPRAVHAGDRDQLPWSPSGDSGARPLSDFLSPEHLEPGYAPAKSELPRSRPGASSVRFHTPAGSADGGAGGEGDEQQQQQQQQPWLRRARQRSSSMESRHTMDWPFAARVRSARYLTEGGPQAERRVIHMELSLKGSGITYEPGDVIGLRCPNPPADTAYVLARLQSVLPEGAGPDVLFHHSLRSLPNPCTLRDALSHRLDLQAPLRRPVLRALSECCQDAAERAWMELLCAKTSGAAVYAAYVSAQSLTLCELLEAFPSCRPTPGVLLALLPPLPPRLYSVASSQLATPDSVAVAFSVVSFRLPHAPSPSSAAAGSAAPTTASAAAAGEGGEVGGGFVTRRGLCTNWLEGLLAPYLEGEGATLGGSRAEGRGGTTVSVPVFLKPTKEFLLPASAKWPCVLIGPGTGVSPFVGFLKHREEQQARRRETADAVCSGYWRGGYEISLEGEEDEATAYRGREGRGDMWLFFGCRNETQDWIFRHEMEEFLAKGTLSKLSTAFSRDAAEKVYVQHRIKEHGAELTRLMLQEGAYVYVCGDGNAMAQGVHKALVEALAEHGDAGGVGGEKGAEAALKVMKEKKRYVLDVWS